MNLFRALFPHWNFFDRVVNTYFLEFKVRGCPTWKRINFTQKRTWFSLFINTDVNLALAHLSLLEHFAQEIEDDSNPPKELLTYKMVKSLVGIKGGEDSCQFRLFFGPKIIFDSGLIND